MNQFHQKIDIVDIRDYRQEFVWEMICIFVDRLINF